MLSKLEKLFTNRTILVSGVYYPSLTSFQVRFRQYHLTLSYYLLIPVNDHTALIWIMYSMCADDDTKSNHPLDLTYYCDLGISSRYTLNLPSAKLGGSIFGQGCSPRDRMVASSLPFDDSWPRVCHHPYLCSSRVVRGSYCLLWVTNMLPWIKQLRTCQWFAMIQNFFLHQRATAALYHH